MKNKYQLCTKTVMDTSDPNISFDENGISDHYHDFQKYVKPHLNNEIKGKKMLLETVKEIKKKGKGKDYDCILGLSGGLDSSYMLHYAIKELKLNPLVFHVDAGWNSELAVHNINVLVEKLGVDLYTEVINWEEIKDLQLAFFKSGVPHLDIPQDMAFISVLYHFAHKHNIKYILNGGNFSTESVQYPMKWLYYCTDLLHVKDIFKKFGTIELKSYKFSSIFFHKIYLRYFKGVKVIKFLNNIKFVQKDAIKLLKKEYDWKPYPQKHFESRFTKFYEGYWLYERFGFDTRRIQLSSLILSNQMKRDQALKILKKPPYDPEKIEDEFNYIATKLGISSNQLREYFNMPKKYYYDYKNRQNIFRLGAKILHFFGVEKVKKRNK